MGICFGDSEHFTEKTREIINHFITNIFAPLFFVSIGLKVNFIENFDLQTVAFVVVVAYIAKVVGVGFGAFWSGLSKQESLAIGFGMNARGAMEIILGLLALEAGVINEKMFVALVVMAIITSITSGPLMKWALSRK
jgi:Kef-type K+ transport system membrane component KefB